MFPAFKALQGRRVILASASPRRLDIFRKGFVPETIPSGFAEDVDWRTFPDPQAYVRMNAEEKVQAIKEDADLIIGCDTVVTVDGVILEKPRDRVHATEMLMSMSGRTIYIYTALACKFMTESGWDMVSSVDEISVDIAPLDEAMIQGYLDLGNGMDNAGALAIQEGGMVFCRAVHGDYQAAVGFPMSTFHTLLTTRLLPSMQPKRT